MLFSGTVFLYFFLPAVLAVYFIAPKKARNAVLLISSLIFYAFGEPVYVALLIFSSVSDYLHSLCIEKYRGTPKAKAALISSIVINLVMLGFFKYADFFIATLNDISGLSVPQLNVPLPIGISFFTFQTMSYTIDVYRGRVSAQKNLLTFATFVCLFPQLIAGPIVRYADIANELEKREHTLDNAACGIRRFTFGLAKKVLIANQLGAFTEAFRSSGEKSVLFFWTYAVAAAMQIYFDFSGYSDMAIGLGRIFGFTFPENFNYPFIARSITDFWRRWHMTLSGWFRDYIYIPLGGNRRGLPRQLLNIALVWLLTGLWHGANWNFVIWGAYFAVLLILEKMLVKGTASRAGRMLGRAVTLVLVAVSFVIFSADGVSGVWSDLSGMFGLGSIPFYTFETGFHLKNCAVLLLLAAVGCTPLPKAVAQRLAAGRVWSRAVPALTAAAVGVLLILCTAYLVDGSYNPFLYFRF